MRLPAPIRQSILDIASRTPLLLGYHYFVTNPVTGTGIAPKFAQAANGGASFTVLTKKGGVKAADPANVDLLQLSSIAGDWASTVFRVDTKAGQPPASCTVGSADISVPYAAKYCTCSYHGIIYCLLTALTSRVLQIITPPLFSGYSLPQEAFSLG
jgi:hypothetical protein